MRTGSNYVESVRDGRKVLVLGEGYVNDITTHPATKPMVDVYADWYDKHRDPEWQDRLLTPASAKADGSRHPLAFHTPKSAAELRLMGESYASYLFSGAGNITHTPAYGNLVALGVRDIVRRVNLSQEEVRKADAYLESVRREGRFVTLANGNPPAGFRYRADPAERNSVRLVRQTDAGIVLSGRLGMHTSPAYAEEVYVAGSGGVMVDGKKATFVITVASPGVTVICRKIASRHQNPFIAPLSSKYDELDGQLWLDEVLVPWEHVFFTCDTSSPAGFAWMAWHQIYCWAAKLEYTLGVALACADVMGQRENQATVEMLVDMLTSVQTVRTSFVAAELDAEVTDYGAYYPNVIHLTSAGLKIFETRQRLTEVLRILPGSSVVMAPSDTDFADEALCLGLEESFGGGGYTALQRSALLNLAWDHASSGLDARESAFELHANGGRNAWRNRLRMSFGDYNALANGVLRGLSVEMPELDLNGMMRKPAPPRPTPTVPTSSK